MPHFEYLCDKLHNGYDLGVFDLFNNKRVFLCTFILLIPLRGNMPNIPKSPRGGIHFGVGVSLFTGEKYLIACCTCQGDKLKAIQCQCNDDAVSELLRVDSNRDVWV